MDTTNKSSCENKETPILQKISPRVIPGPLSANNKGAIDWGWQSLVAYGCNNHVIVVDTSNLKLFQSLKKHKADVVKVRWSRESHHHDTFNPYSLVLASGDASGKIVVWDVKQGVARKTMSEGNKPVAEMEWVTGASDGCHHLLTALHPPATLVVWNTETGQPLWRKVYTGEHLQSFSFDPFTSSNLALLATDSIIFVEDFQLNKTPKGPGRKFHISAPISASTSKVGSPTVPEEKSKISHLLTRRISFLTKADSKTSEEVVALNECLQLIYHRSYRHHLLLVYPREVLVLDLEIYQTVGIVTTTSPLQSVLTTSQRDSLLCLHENGSVSFRLRSHHPPAAENTKEGFQATEVTYDSHCQSDSFRLTKNSRVVGMSISPVQETTVALLVSDGRLVFQHLLPHKTEGSHVPYSVMPPCLGDLLPPYHHLAPGTIPRLRFLLSGVLGALAAAPHVLAMCPPVTYRNWRYHQPLLAIGTSQGNVQAINMAIGMIEKELSIHSAPVRGIEWVGLSAFISFSHPNLSASQGQVRNELAITDIHSGRSRSFRQDRSDESPIQMVRVSQLKQYFIIVFKEEPFELWDLANLTLLRTMPKTFPAITALTWYPLHSKKNQHHRGDSLDLGISDTPLPGISELTPLGMKTSVLNKEHFVVTDVEGQLYHFIIEGNVIHTGSFIPPEAGMGSITSLVWKTDQIVMGDADGNLNIWDIKERVSRGVSTRRGWIKKIKFAPGRGNMRILVLFNDGVDLWDVKQVERISSLKTPTDLPKIQDIDWASSDRPVFSTVDGCIVMTDFSLKSFSSPLIEYHNTDPCYLPSTLSVKLAFHLKSSLQLQPNFTIDPPGLSTEDRKALELMALEPVVERQLSVCSLAERCLVVARLFGDEEAIHFWTVALHYLLAAVPKDKDPPEETYFACHAALPLDTCYDLLCDIPEYQKLQVERAQLHDAKRSTPAQTQKCAERMLLLGQTDRAVQLLLETEPTSDTYRIDTLQACLIATAPQSPGPAQSVVKLVATNMIAAGHITEGVQLLVLIGKSVDACRYLQSAGHWDTALWLAKSTLEPSDLLEVVKRSADHLCSPGVNQKGLAALHLLSVGQFWRVVELLHGAKMAERAALLLSACLELRVLDLPSLPQETVNSIFLDYARYLLSLNNCHGALQYCHLVTDDSAADLKKEMMILMEDCS